MVCRFINASKIEIYKKKSYRCGLRRYLGGTLPPGGRHLTLWPAAVRPTSPQLAAPTTVDHGVMSLTP
jgi:hypothetical protein